MFGQDYAAHLETRGDPILVPPGPFGKPILVSSSPTEGLIPPARPNVVAASPQPIVMAAPASAMSWLEESSFFGVPNWVWLVGVGGALLFWGSSRRR